MPSKQGPRLHTRLSNLRHPKSTLDDIARSHPINSCIQLLLPSVQAVSDAGPLPACLELPSPSHLTSCRLGDLIVELLTAGVFAQPPPPAAALFEAVAFGDRLDGGNGIAITPDGKLHLAVSRDVYQQLGLVGARSTTDPGERYNICVHLPGKSFQAGNHNYERVIACLNDRLSPATLLCLRERDGVAMPELALAAGGTTTAVPLTYSCRRSPAVAVPQLTRDLIDALSTPVPVAIAAGQQGCRAPALLPALHEWLGALGCGWEARCVDALLPEDMPTQTMDVDVHAWRGLLSATQVLGCVHHAASLVRSGAAPWACVAAWGFADCPVAWGDREHCAGRGGADLESHYSVLLMPGDHYCVFTAGGAVGG